MFRYVDWNGVLFSDSYETAMEIDIAPFNKVNGISTVANGQCVVINGTQNITFDETVQVKNPNKNSVGNTVIELKDGAQDVTDSDVHRTAKRRRKSIASLSEVNLKPSKLFIAFGVFCVIGFSLPPTILHFVEIDLQLHDNLCTSDNFSVVSLSNKSVFISYCCIDVVKSICHKQHNRGQTVFI